MNKHLLLPISFLVFCIGCKQNTKYVISGNVTSIPDSTVVRLYKSYDRLHLVVGTDTIKNGRFQFTGLLDSSLQNMMVMLVGRKEFGGLCELWITPSSNTRISGDGPFLSQWRAESGVKEQAELNTIKNSSSAQWRMLDSLNRQQIRIPRDDERFPALRKAILNKKYDIFDLELAHLNEIPNTIAATKILHQIFNYGNNEHKVQVERIYDKLDNEYKSNVWSESINIALQDIPSSIGDSAISFAAYDLEKNLHVVHKTNKKYLLLDFWSSACIPCRRASKELHKVHKDLGDVVKIVSITQDIPLESWRKATLKDSISWVNLSDGKGSLGICKKYNVKAIPDYILISPTGIIVDRWFGYTENSILSHLQNQGIVASEI